MIYSSVIVTYNRKEKLIEAIDSLLNQTLQPRRIIIIDNNSSDGTPNLLEKKDILKNDKVNYIRLDKNLGGSGGFYEGVKEALNYDDDEYISLSDDDAIFDKHYFEYIEKAISKYPGYKAFSGTVKYEDGSIQTTHRRKIVNKKILKERDISTNEYAHDFDIDTFSFVGCVISKEILKKIGLPKKEYFIFYDDTEYSLRIRQYTKIKNIVNAGIIHKTVKNNNSKIEFTWKSYYGIRNQINMKCSYSDWKYIKYFFILKKYKEYIDIILNKDYAGMKKKYLRIIYYGYRDGLAGKTGKCGLYLPGKEL